MAAIARPYGLFGVIAKRKHFRVIAASLGCAMMAIPWPQLHPREQRGRGEKHISIARNGTKGPLDEIVTPGDIPWSKGRSMRSARRDYREKQPTLTL